MSDMEGIRKTDSIQRQTGKPADGKTAEEKDKKKKSGRQTEDGRRLTDAGKTPAASRMPKQKRSAGRQENARQKGTAEGRKNTRAGKKKRPPEDSKRRGTARDAGRPRDSERTVRHRRRRRKPHPLQIIILVTALAVFCYSAVSLIQIFLEYKKGTDTYDKIAAQFVMDPSEEEDGTPSEDTGVQETFSPLNIDFAALKEANPDVYGWIQMPGLDVSYPVVQAADNNYYLYRMADGTDNTAGSIFVEAANGPDFLDSNTILYGHNMRNGSMFGRLKDYGEEEFFQENPSFYLYTEEGAWGYDIFSVRVVSATGDSYQISFASAEDFTNYIDNAVRTSMYDTGVVPQAGDTMVTLSTCTSSDENRLIVQAVRGEQVN